MSVTTDDVEHASDGHATGTLKSFERKNGFGFLACPELFEKYTRDVFIHQAFIGNLQVGDPVDFEYRINDKGQPQVVSVAGQEAQKPTADATSSERIYVFLTPS